MKYCPYCGAELPDNDISFCTECGKSLPGEKKEPNTEKTIQSKKADSEKISPVDSSPIEDDGYYDDVLPMDDGRQRDGLDPMLIRKIVILVCGLVLVIDLCVALMYLL